MFRRGVGRYSDFLSLRREHHNDRQFWVREKEDGKPISLFLCLCYAFFVLQNCQSVFNLPWYISNGQNIFSLTKNKQTARQKTMINLFSITFKEFKGDVKDFFQPGFHRGGHGRQSGGEARGEHADQRVTTVMMMDMMMMMMMMVVVMVKIFNR